MNRNVRNGIRGTGTSRRSASRKANLVVGVALWLGLIVVGALFLSSGLAADPPPANYGSAVEPQFKPAFLPLPRGAVEPRGWLRDWAVKARDGITGHADEYYEPFLEDWKGPSNYEVGGRPDAAMGLGAETCYWLDGLFGLGCILHDDALAKKATGRFDLVVDGVNRGALSFAYWRKERPEGSYNSYGLAQMGRALVAYYEVSRDKRILDALVKAYWDFPTPMGHLEFREDISGLQNLEPLLDAYPLSGDRRLLERARAAMGTPEVQTTIRNWLDGKFVVGHGVCAYEQLRLPAQYCLWTGEEKYLRASRNAYQWVTTEHMLPHDLISAEEWMSGIGAFRLTETCDIMSHLWTSATLYQIVGEGSYGDRMERALFNAGPAPISRDFKTASYLQAPNRIQAESLPVAWAPALLRSVPIIFPPCCHGALNRIIPSYVMHMWMATHDRGLAATLYGPCVVNAFVGDRTQVRLSCDTVYPFNDTIRVAVEPEKSCAFPLYFRIPSWCAKPQLSVNGAGLNALPDKNGFVRINRTWVKTEFVVLTFPMSARVARGYEREYPASATNYFAAYRPPAHYSERRLPFTTVSYGPLLFALPLPDEDPNTLLPGAKWRYALDTDAARNGDEIEVERNLMPAKWDWSLDTPIALKVPAQMCDWKPTESQALPAMPVEGTKSETIRLVPYGCTKFRISMFPVTAKAWGKNGDR